METLKEFLDRNERQPDYWLKEHLDKPFAYKRSEFPRWYLTSSQHKVLFGSGPKVKDLVAFTWSAPGRTLVPLYDCKQRIQKFLE